MHALASRFVLAALATSALVAAACSGGQVAVGSNDQKLLRKSDGTPTGNGATCSWSDAVAYDARTGQTTRVPAQSGEYKVGDTFKSLDGCNDCTCLPQGIACTARACAPKPGGKACTVDGRTYEDGASVPSRDGCNSCSCMDGAVACTAMACAPDAGAGVCTYDGRTHRVGERFGATDGCNTCSCGEGGVVACTERACLGCAPPRQPPEGVACPAVIAYGKNPVDGTCCEYSDPCHVPSGWKQFYSDAECRAAGR